MAALDAVNAGFANCHDYEDGLCKWKRNELEPWEASVIKALEDPDPLAFVEVLGRGPTMRVKKTGAKGNWANNDVDSQRDLVAALRETRSAVLEEPRIWAANGVLRLLSRLCGCRSRKAPAFWVARL